MIPVQDVRIHPPLLYAEGICFLIFCPFFVGLRFYARRVAGSSLGLDDGAAFLALLLTIALAIIIIVDTANKYLGYEVTVGDPDGDAPGHPNVNKPTWPFELIQVPALAFIKLSFLFLYKRVFTKRVRQHFNWVNMGMIVLVTAWGISFFFALLFMCGTDFAAYWTSSETEQEKCPTYPIHMAFTCTDVITDVFTILLPLPEIWKLHLSWRRKLAITGVFSIGAITIAMSVLRLVIYYNAMTVEFDPIADFEYITSLAMYISMLEAGLGLITSCLPVTYGLLRSEKMRDLMRTVASITSLGSSHSGQSGISRTSRLSRLSRGGVRTRQFPPATKLSDSQGSQTDVTLPEHTADSVQTDIELGDLASSNGVAALESSGTEEETRRAKMER